MADIKIAGRIKAGSADGISGYASEILFDDAASNKTVKEKIEEVASSPQTMIVTISPDGNEGYEADKTFAEIKAFIDNGGTVIAKDEEDGDSFYYLDNYIASEVVFTRNIWGSGGFSTRYYTIDNTNTVSFIDSVHHISSAVDSSSTTNLANSAAVKALRDSMSEIKSISVNNVEQQYDQEGNVDIAVPTSLADLAGDSTHRTVTDAEKTTWNGKQNALTFDNVPTANSNNPVKSGGVYQAIQDIDVSSQISGKEDKSNKVTSFSSPTDTQYPSAKLVSDQLATKQGTISDLSTIRSNAAAGATAYQKPGTGIPKTDLASAVQTSLGKADTAIQSVTVGTTTTGAAGSSASVTNTGTATAPVLSFTIPQGAQGIQGIQGPQGERGPQGNTGVQVDSVASIIHSIDPTATYAAADVAGADAVQDVLSEVTELAGVELDSLLIRQKHIQQDNTWGTAGYHAMIFVEGYSMVSIKANDSENCIVALLKSAARTKTANYATGAARTNVPAGSIITLDIPSDAKYLYVIFGADTSYSQKPDYVKLYSDKFNKLNDKLDNYTETSYAASSFPNAGLLLSDGTIQNNRTTQEYRTSDFIPVDRDMVLIYKDVFPTAKSWVGICVYDYQKQLILPNPALGSESVNNGIVNLSQYEDVSYVRVSTNAVISDATTLIKLRKNYTLGEIADIIDDVAGKDTTPTENSTNLVTSGGVYNALNNGYQKNYSTNLVDNYFGDRLVTEIYNTGQSYGRYNTRAVLLLPPTPASAKRITVASNLEYMVHFLSGIDDSVIAPYIGLELTFLSESAYATGERTVTIPEGTTRIDLQFKSEDASTILSSITKLEYGCTSTATVLTDFDIVDNLIDGGTDKVLSAEQGKVLGGYTKSIDYIIGSPTATFTDITTVGRTDASILDVSLDSTNNIIKFEAKGTKASYKYAWVNLPSNLVNGQTYRMSFDSTVSLGSGCDGWLAISTNTTNSDTGYTDGIGVTSNAHRTLTFEKTAAKSYLIIAANSMGNTGAYMYISNLEFHAYSGETYDSLPTLTTKVDEFIGSFADASTVGYYGGEKVPSLNRWRIGAKKIMNNATCQAGTVYGNYLFQFTNHHADMKVYDLSTKALHSTVTMTSASSDHCNNACFSNIFYDTNDDFPLIYTSGSSTSTYNHVQVWRIQLTDNVFSITKVQEITLPTGATGNIWYWGQAYLDNERKNMWYSTNIGGNAYFMKFSIPAIFDENDNVVSEVTLTDSDVIDSFTTLPNTNQQGGVVKNGILYLFDGVPEWGTYTKLYVYNLWSKSLINVIDVYSILGVTAEFEGCGIWNDTLIANTYGAGIYAIYL